MVLGQKISLWFVTDLEERLRALFFFLCAMSRCFPFPPPGYEKKKKLSSDDAHILLKEKPKEKKEKKDRKERSEEKRREKKEKKRKDKKDKKDKKRSDSEKVLEETSKHQSNGIHSTHSEPQFLVELENRTRLDDGATQSKIIATNNGSEKYKENHIEAKEKFMDKRMVNGQTLTVEVKGTIDEKLKEKKKHRRSSDGGIGETRGDKKRKKEKKKEEKSKEQINHTLDIHGSSEGNGGKRKFPQFNGVLHDKDSLLAPKFPRSISMEMENGSKYNSSQVITVHNTQVNGTKLEQKITLNNNKVHTGILLTQPVQEPKKLLELSEAPKKLTTNLELEVSSSLLVVKNGVKSDIQTALDLDTPMKHVNDSLKKTEETKQSELKVGTSSQPNIETNNTHMVNGVIKKHKSKKVKEKPPHPDLKYLNEILTVPPQLEWSEFDDQEWLFSNNSNSKANKSISTVEEETKQVWSEALLLESEDIIALPYVIPY